MATPDFNALLQTKDYDFLRTNPRLSGRIMLLGLSGSYGYGTNREGSDVDFRGVTLNLPSDLIGLTSFEQFEECLLHTLSAYISSDGRVVAFSCNLVYFINEDDAPFSLDGVVVSFLEES